MHPALRLVSDRLPSVRGQAEILFERDDVFRDLCDEYRACDETAKHLERARGSRAKLRWEYGALRLRLEGELLRYLAEHPAS